MSLSDTSIKNPVFAWMLMLGLMIFGAICFTRLGVSQLPDVDFPVVSVSVSLEGAAPEVMETTVVDPIEDSLMTVQGVRSISSSSKHGSANVSMEFELDKDINVAIQEIQTKITQIQRNLPKDMDPPNISKTNPDDQPIMWLAVSAKSGDRLFLNKYVRDNLKDKFATVSGVGDVFLGGYVEPNLRVWVNPSELKRRNIAVTDIISSIQSGHSELPGGQIETETKNFNVRTMGEAKSVEEFGNIVINSRAGQAAADPFNIVKLKDVSRIEEGLAEISRTSRFNQELAIGIGIRKQKGSNAVAVANKVKEKVKELQSTLPEGISLRLNFDSTQFIEDSVRELNFTLLLSALLTALACWFFLGSISATINVVLAIPTSILGTFIPLYFLGFTLNTFTLLGLSLAIGIVVDDAIMVLENIFRYQEKGHNKISAAIMGSREITFAAMAATVAIIAIFLPVAFMKGVIGKFFMQFGVTISFAVFLSLIEALTITPMRSAQFVTLKERTSLIGRSFEAMMRVIRRVYERALTVCLRFRWVVLFGSVVFLILSFALVKKVNKEFSPAQDQSIFLVRLQAPAGSSLRFTDSKVKLAEAFLSTRSEVKQYYVAVGGFGGGAGEVNTAVIFVTMKPKNERPLDPEKGHRLSQQEFMDVTRKALAKIKDIKPIIQDLSMRGFTSSRGFPIEFAVQGGDWEKLHDYTKEIMTQMEKTGLMQDVDSNYLLGAPEIQITPDRKAASLHGVSIQSIGQTVSSLIGGVRVGQYPKEGRRYDVRLQVEKKYSTIDEIQSLLVGNSRSNLVPLSQLVKQETRPSLQSISRIDRQRSISVFANLIAGASQQIAIQKVSEIAKNVLPSGYNIKMSGSAQTLKESTEGLLLALVLGILIAYMVLATQFNSFLDPISVLVALPFSISGAFIALLISGQSLNMYSMIGIILLMGIVKKNSILLVEFTNTTIESGIHDVNSALLKACPVRLRPILMTSFATIVGAIPPALAIGPGSETRVPMAISIIGGVLVSTILTLLVVPCFYSVISKFHKKRGQTEQTLKAFHQIDLLERSIKPEIQL